MTNEFTLTNLHKLKKLEKQVKKWNEERLPDKTLLDFKEPKSVETLVGTKIEELAVQYSYAEVLNMAKQHDIQTGRKVEMLSRLIEKGVDEVKNMVEEKKEENVEPEETTAEEEPVEVEPNEDAISCDEMREKILDLTAKRLSLEKRIVRAEKEKDQVDQDINKMFEKTKLICGTKTKEQDENVAMEKVIDVDHPAEPISDSTVEDHPVETLEEPKEKTNA